MESLSQENRKFNPNPQFVKQAKIAGMDAYKELYQKSIEKPLEFWSDVANELHWFKPWYNKRSGCCIDSITCDPAKYRFEGAEPIKQCF